MRALGLASTASIAAGIVAAAAQSPAPLPPPRPDSAAPEIRLEPLPEAPAPAVPPPAAKAPAAPADPLALCISDLAARGIEAERASPPDTRNAACRIERPVRLVSARSNGRAGGSVAFLDKPVMDCRLAGAVGAWAGTLAAPLAEGHLGRELKAVRTGPGFECRNRNRAAGGKLSAHATGLALDIARFDLAGDDALRVGSSLEPAAAAFFAALRRAGCGWFTTILGPGSDAAHADHLHVDILQHGSSDRYRICE